MLPQGSYKTLPSKASVLECDPVQGCLLSSMLDSYTYMVRPQHYNLACCTHKPTSNHAAPAL